MITIPACGLGTCRLQGQAAFDPVQNGHGPRAGPPLAQVRRRSDADKTPIDALERKGREVDPEGLALQAG